MTDYIPITEAETDPEAPSTSSLWKRWWKNPIAMFEGAAGAPRLQNAALAAECVTNSKLAAECVTNSKIADGTIGAEKFQSGADEVAWVGARMADLGVNAVGDHAILARGAGQTIVYGDIYAGSGLTRQGFSIGSISGGNALAYSSGSTPSGSWMALQSVSPPSGYIACGLFRRVA